jgi:heme exporter protein A
MLQVTDLIFDYSDKLLLQNVNFSVKPGTVLHIQGKNGVGKTTLLKLLAGLLQPIKGHITGAGQSCYVGHQNGVNLSLTPDEHMRFDLGVQDKAILDKALTRLNLKNARDTPCGLLSAGQKRRVGLLRLLIMEAKLWLLDEPLVGLDTAGMDILGDLIKAHLKQAGMVILTAHQVLPFDLNARVLKELVL